MKLNLKKLYILITIIQIITNQIITIPFKTKKKDEILTEENLISNLIENEIYIEIKVGNPKQTIPLFLKLNQYPTYIISSQINLNIPTFDYTKSKTFIFKEEKDKIYYNFDFNKGKLSEDTFYLIDSNSKEIKIDNFTFILGTETKKEKEKISGEIGLKLSLPFNNEKVNFINNIKNKKITKIYPFSIKYNNKNENIGEFTFGNYYHNFDHNYNEKDFKIMKVGIPRSDIEWQLHFHIIYMNNELVSRNNIVDLSYEFGLILGTFFYYNKIKEFYFNNYTNDCIEKLFNNDNYIYFECSSNIDINKFPELKFINNGFDFNFTFNGNDLFYKFKDKYFFQIIFQNSPSVIWKFGKLFFKKYHIFFDNDNKIIGLYPYSISYSNKFNYNWFILIILLIIIIGLLIYIKLYSRFRKKKIRANELEDEFNNFEYSQNKYNYYINVNVGKENLLKI